MNRSAMSVMGPAKVVYNAATAATFYSKNNFEIRRTRETFRIGAQGVGDDERDGDILHEVSIVPDGRWTAAIIGALWPHLNKLPGNGFFTDTDRTLVCTGTDGMVHTLTSVAVTRMPNVKFSATESLIGPVTFMGLLGNNMDWDDANSRETLASGGTFVDANYTANTLVKTQPYVGALGSTFPAIETLDGFEVVFNLRTNKIAPNRLGTYQINFAGLDMAVNFIPINLATADILAAAKVQGTGAARGRSMYDGAEQFTIVGDDAITYLTIPKARVKNSATRWGVGDNYTRDGEISVVASWNLPLGVQSALCTFAAS